MSRRHDQAIEKLNARGLAVTEGATEVNDDTAMVHANPGDFARRMLSGFVPPEDMDAAVQFLGEATEGVRRNWLLNPTASARTGLVLTTMAQVMVYAIALTEADDE